MIHPRYELVQTKAGWHVRWRAPNAEPVWAGENLTSRESAITAMLSVAEAHSPVSRASYAREMGQVLVYLNHGDWHTSVQVVEVDERPARALLAIARYLRGRS